MGCATLHVLFDRLDRRQLIGRFAVGKRLFEFVLPFGIATERDPGSAIAFGLQFDHFGSQIGDGGLRPMLSVWPTICRQFLPAMVGFWSRQCTFAPGRFWWPARRFLCRREIPVPDVRSVGRLCRAFRDREIGRFHVTSGRSSRHRAGRGNCRSPCSVDRRPVRRNSVR